MVELGNVVKTADGAIGAVVDWVYHGMRPGIFTIAWDETTCAGSVPPQHWTRAECAALTVLS
ncbi:hypothetical protein [Mycolicibacterium aubagnense]|uniref:PRC-barrel domain-containing protein n=1 Tax=Mycolicibacterium aubagnense TaxID=319707 RepID=A0ABN5YKM1_9MYCO|nr:hypothetical protein [Mycolicibacterium aubagnense]TLH48982.1 hypothetical protein C1S80_29305 [Mycolicibacterium aubagnense]BBX82231.1 hypothetical protein MAUB_01040 [Mycolicibacterium aubagnense]